MLFRSLASIVVMIYAREAFISWKIRTKKLSSETKMLSLGASQEFMPLDIVTLLGVDEGERGHTLDVLKELSHECTVQIDANNPLEISQPVVYSW